MRVTATPGAHFDIRREACRRITEALAAKGIPCAHRKVIVEVAGGDDGEKTTIGETGAAAVVAVGEAQQKIVGGET